MNKATLTVAAPTLGRYFGRPNPTFTAAYTGFVNGDTAGVLSGAPSLTTTATVSSQVGTGYPVTAALGTLSAKNYSFAFQNGVLGIVQLPGLLPAGLSLAPTDVTAGEAIVATISENYPISDVACTYAGNFAISSTTAIGSIDTSNLSAGLYTAACQVTVAQPTPPGWGTICGCTPGSTIPVSIATQANFTVSQSGTNLCQGGGSTSQPATQTISTSAVRYTWTLTYWVEGSGGTGYNQQSTTAIANGTTDDAGVQDCNGSEVKGPATPADISGPVITYNNSSNPPSVNFQWTTQTYEYSNPTATCNTCPPTTAYADNDPVLPGAVYFPFESLICPSGTQAVVRRKK